MLENYFKIAWRNISRNKIYTIINVLGLALGICACITIFLITSFELSFDTSHPDKDRIYHIAIGIPDRNGSKVYFQSAPPPAPFAVRQELSGIEAVAGFQRYGAKISILDGNKPPKKFDNNIEGSGLPETVIAEPQYFSIFKYDWLAGNAATALNEPFKVVLTESRARKYFGYGSLENIIGKTVIYDDSLLVQVSGILKDWNKNTDFPFTDFISFSTISHSFLKNNIQLDDWDQKDIWTLVKLSKGTSPAKINTQLAALVKRHVKEDPQKQRHLANLTLSLKPLSNLHFNGDFEENEIRTADLPTLYGLMGIALFILILAIVNFINLSTAQSIERAKEIGVRKVLGGSRISLIFQFLTEAFVISIFAVLLAVVFVNPVLSAFQSFLPPGVTFHPFNPLTSVFLILITLVTSLLAGFYPAMVLSRYMPVISLRGSRIQKPHERWHLRKGLIVFQFTVSLIFIIGTIVISMQLRFIRNKNLGFTTGAIVTLYPNGDDSISKVKILAQKIMQLPGVAKVALQSNPPLSGVDMGMSIKYKSRNEYELPVEKQVGDENFIPLYQMRLLAGRNLMHSDQLKELVINETCSKILGFTYPKQAIGQLLYVRDKPYPIVGVVADFHQHSFHELIKPMCIVNQSNRENRIAVKLVTKGKELSNAKATLLLIEKVFKEIYPNDTFYYNFFDESIAQLYKKDQRTGWLMNTSMIITIFISCMGLFGVTMFAVEQRTKEIGIRKVLGASVTQIATLLSKDFVILVIIALTISSPIAYYFMNRWLQDFAYRINISWWVFALAGSGAILIALSTVSFQAIKVAITNPVKCLRTE